MQTAHTYDKIRVIHVDDEEDSLFSTKKFLEDVEPELQVESTQNQVYALTKAKERSIDCIVTDYKMPGMNGIDLTREIRRFSDVPVVLYTGRGNEEVAQAAFAAGVTSYIRKETDPDHYRILAKTIQEAAYAHAEITERKKVEEELRESEEKYRFLAENAADTLFTVDLNGIITYVSKAVHPETGYNREEIIGHNFLDFIIEEDKEFTLRVFGDATKNLENWAPVAARTHKKDGGIVVLEYNPSSIMKNNSLVGIQVVVRDITARFEQQVRLRALHDSAIKLEVATTLKDVWDITVNDLHNAIGFNTIVVALIENDKILFNKFIGIEPPQDQAIPIGESILGRVIKNKKSLYIPDTRLDPEYKIFSKRPDESHQYLSELDVPVNVDDQVYAVIRSESEKVNNYTPEDQIILEIFSLHVSNAITRINILENLHNQVEERSQRLIQAEQMATAGRMAATVAHDLRGPLQAITNGIYMIRRKPESTESMLKLMEDAAGRSVKMLDELRQNTREGPLDYKYIDFTALLKDFTHMLMLPDGVKLELDLDKTINLEIDPLRIRRVFENLTRNAIEAMQNGGTLRLSAIEESGYANVEVKDTGIGMTPEVLKNLFQPFYTTKTSGIGLGLAYCKRTVEAHGGTITATSVLGQGTTFKIRLPIKR